VAYQNPGLNQTDAPSSLTPDTRTAPAAVTSNPAKADKAPDWQTRAAPTADPIAPAYGMRNRSADEPAKVPGNTSHSVKNGS
jgi:hypothetical protein